MRRLPPLVLLIAAAPAPPPIMPGYWEVTGGATHVEVPGLPHFLAGLAERTHTSRRCVTAEEAARGPVQQLGNRKDCTMIDDRIAGGTILVTALCPTKNGMQTRIHVEGRYTPAEYATTGTITSIGGQRGDMRIDFTDAGKRLGDCPAGKGG